MKASARRRDDDTELEAARAAKAKARKRFAGLARVSGVGITRAGGRYAVKVLCEAIDVPAGKLPDNIDGVPVVVDVTGPIRKQTAR
jgi:hypothetical protein